MGLKSNEKVFGYFCRLSLLHQWAYLASPVTIWTHRIHRYVRKMITFLVFFFLIMCSYPLIYYESIVNFAFPWETLTVLGMPIQQFSECISLRYWYSEFPRERPLCKITSSSHYTMGSVLSPWLTNVNAKLVSWLWNIFIRFPHYKFSFFSNMCCATWR
jgi:hypothetical protein